MLFKNQLTWLLFNIWYPIVLYKNKKALIKLGVEPARATRLAELQIQKQIDKIVKSHLEKGDK